METATGSNGSATPAKTRAPAPDEDDLKAKIRLRKKEQSSLGWGRVTRFIFRLMLKHPFMVGGVLFMTLFLAAFEVANAMLLAPFLNMLIGDIGPLADSPIAVLVPYFDGMSIAAQLRWYAGIFFGLTLFKAVFLYGLTRLAQYLHIVINRDLRMMLFEDIVAVEMRWINKQRSSNLFTLVHSFPGSASKIVDQYMMGFQNFTSFLALVVTLALVSIPLLLLSATIGLVVTAVAVQLTRWVRYLAYEVKESRLRLHNITLESLSAIKVLHLFGRTQHTLDRYNHELKGFQRNQFKQASIKATVTPVQSILAAAFIASILVGATIIYDLTTGGFLATIALFMTIVTKFQSRSSKYAKRRAEIAAEVPAMEEIIDHLENKEKRYIKDGKQRFGSLQDGIHFNGVRFGYEADEPDVIKGVDIRVPRGSMLAIVGASGAGKSTLIDLLARIYDPDEGQILIDGVDLRDLRIADWRRRVAVVSQDSFLFNTSVRENIRFGRLDATDEETEEAARQANALAFIEELPHGFETTLGDRGVRLSGGQRQRIAIARAILADPDVLILDEATSALDTETESQVQAAIDEVAKDRTIIAIAHRLSTVRKADQIVVLEHGEVVESGRHDELLAQRGRYWEYVQLQDLGRVKEGPAGLPADERVAWIEFTLHRRPHRLVEAVLELEGVRAARVRGDRLEVVAETPSQTLPRLFRVFGEKRFRVERIDLDELAESEGVEVYRWSGNGPSDGANDLVWLALYVEGASEALLRRLRSVADVQEVSASAGRIELVLQRPQQALPAIVRAAGPSTNILAIDPIDARAPKARAKARKPRA